MSQPVIPVILSGGSGTRLWPVSTAARPKQFQPLLTDRPMIAETAQRVADNSLFDRPIVIGNVDHEQLLAECLAATPPQLTMLEPEGRNTAAAVAIAALAAERIDPDATIVILPSDHVIRDVRGFIDTTREAVEIASRGYLVTYGIVPTEPHTGYGYIERGDRVPVAGSGSASAYQIRRFIEKPDRPTAIQLLAAGGYSWNSGMFVFKVRTVLTEFAELAPEILAACRAAVEGAEAMMPAVLQMKSQHFDVIPNIAFDRAIMEKTSNAMVLPAIFDWSDVGSWWAIRDMAEAAGLADARGNVVHGRMARIDGDVENCYVRNDTDVPLFVTGLEEAVVVASSAGIVVTNKQNEQNVKRAVEIFKGKS